MLLDKALEVFDNSRNRNPMKIILFQLFFDGPRAYFCHANLFSSNIDACANYFQLSWHFLFAKAMKFEFWSYRTHKVVLTPKMTNIAGFAIPFFCTRSEIIPLRQDFPWVECNSISCIGQKKELINLPLCPKEYYPSNPTDAALIFSKRPNFFRCGFFTKSLTFMLAIKRKWTKSPFPEKFSLSFLLFWFSNQNQSLLTNFDGWNEIISAKSEKHHKYWFPLTKLRGSPSSTRGDPQGTPSDEIFFEKKRQIWCLKRERVFYWGKMIGKKTNDFFCLFFNDFSSIRYSFSL